LGWHNPKEDTAGRMCKFKERHSNTYNPFADIIDRRSLMFYTQVVVHESREVGKVGTWKLRGEERI
jgi:hypothetical protein